MRIKGFCCALLACLTIVASLSVNALAANNKSTDTSDEHVIELVIMRASGSFNMSIPSRSKVLADKSFPLSSGETVRINASYSPDASVDFGLVDPDGVFHYFNVTDGNIDKTIRVNESGNYTLQVRNNSSATVKVAGFVYY